MSGGRWRRRAARVVVSAAWLGLEIAATAGRARAAAEGASGTWIEVTGCPSSWERDVRQAIAVELGGTSGDANAGPAGARADGASGSALSIGCGLDRVALAARGPASGERLERTLSLDQLPAATAPRVVALAAVELLAALDPALRRRLAAQAATPPVRNPGSSPAAAGDHRLSLVASGVYRAFVAEAGLHAWGGALDGRRASASGTWAIGLGVEVAGGGRSSSLGPTSALLASIRASAGARARLAGGALALSVDAGARVGEARLVGRSGDPDVRSWTAVRPWGGPLVAVSGQVGLSWLCLQLAVEGGWAAVSATGLVDDARALAVSGPWVAASLGLGLRAR